MIGNLIPTLSRLSLGQSLLYVTSFAASLHNRNKFGSPIRLLSVESFMMHNNHNKRI